MLQQNILLVIKTNAKRIITLIGKIICRQFNHFFISIKTGKCIIYIPKELRLNQLYHFLITYKMDAREILK